MTNPLESEQLKALLRDWARGSRDSGEALLSALLPGIYGLCLRMLRNEADAHDAAQETFARLCAEVRKGTEIKDVKKWLATVAMNRSIDLQRQRGRTVLLEEGGPLEPAAFEPQPIERLDADTLRTWMEELPARYKLVLHYHFSMGMAPREIAQTMGLEDGTARVLLHRAVSALRKKART